MSAINSWDMIEDCWDIFGMRVDCRDICVMSVDTGISV